MYCIVKDSRKREMTASGHLDRMTAPPMQAQKGPNSSYEAYWARGFVGTTQQQHRQRLGYLHCPSERCCRRLVAWMSEVCW